MTAHLALVRRPSPRLAEGMVTKIERQPIDYELACKQWNGYVDALAEAGWQTVEVPPADDCPDSVFVEDTMVAFKNVVVMTRPGALSRRSEIVAAEPVARRLGYGIDRIVSPGTLDGGDVLKVGDTVYVGRGGRTNSDGIEQLRAILSPMGAKVIAVPVSKVLHLKSAVTALPNGAIIGYPPLVDSTEPFPEFVPVPEESGAHVVVLDRDRVLVAADCPRSVDVFVDRGYTPIVVDISEFQKLEGCVTCLSVRLRGRPHRN